MKTPLRPLAGLVAFHCFWSPSTVLAAPAVEEFAIKESRYLGDGDGGGCGLFLQRQGGRKDRWLLVWSEGETDPYATEMKLDGKMTRFKLTATSGRPVRAEKPLRTYLSQDGQSRVQLELKIGRTLDEGFEIPAGTLRVRQNGQETVTPIRGSRGCQ